MASANLAAYCWEDFGPAKIKNNVTKLQNTGLTTAILWAVHVGAPNNAIKHKYGDLIFNNDKDHPENLFISQGLFNPNKNSQTGAWPEYVAKLKQGGVNRVFFSIGGGGVTDFTAIEYMLTHNMTDVLAQNLDALRTAFTDKATKQCAIDGFDLDSEESVSQDTIVKFSAMLFKLKFAVTFCPYRDQDFWKGCMKTLWDNGRKVSWWNLQCYDGGDPNRKPEKLDTWIKALAAVVGEKAAPSFLLPGLAVMGSGPNEQCPGGICRTFSTWKDHKLGGGWLWRYDDIGKKPCPGRADLTAYVDAINKGLKNQCT